LLSLAAPNFSAPMSVLVSIQIPKKTNFLTLHSNEFEIHTSSLVLQDGTG
jgi:hypothetical protein